jgi:hypothetical protein
VGFFDEYDESRPSGGAVGEAEKKELVRSKVVFPVLSVWNGKTQYDRQFALGTELNGEARTLWFGEGSVSSRDEMLLQLAEYLAREDAEPVELTIRKSGRAYILMSPERAAEFDAEADE